MENRKEWRVIPGWPYQICEDGSLVRYITRYGNQSWKPIRSHIDTGGYHFVHLYRQYFGVPETKTFGIHRLVCLGFYGPQPTPDHEVAHADGNKNNNIRENVRWATRSENQMDIARHGSRARGEGHPHAKLTWAQVEEIRREHGRLKSSTGKKGTKLGNGKLKAMAERYGVSLGTLCSIVKFDTWVPFSKVPSSSEAPR